LTAPAQSLPLPAPSAPAPALPYATAARPGCGGRIKAAPEDFRVDELPLYPPSGAGEHLYVHLWKRGLSTQAAVQRLSEATGIPLRSIGFAGRKDAQAVTTQWISLHAPGEPPLHRAESADLRILATARHANKLRRGHLLGNRFTVRVRDAALPEAWDALLAECVARGFPNLFGPQRFGPGGANAGTGRRLLAQRRGARRLRDPERFAIHALQAALFNALVGRRIAETPGLDRLLAGDLAVLHRNGAAFPVTADGLAEAQARADAAELSASAPLFGCRIALAEGLPGQWEAEALRGAGLAPEDFRFGTKDASIGGERRPVRAFPRDCAWRREPDALVLEFTLGPGTYATALLRELMKTPDLDTPGFAADSE
jgi:tRNA pseudouridine13 synthase